MKKIMKELLERIGIKSYYIEYFIKKIVEKKNKTFYSNNILAEKHIKREYFKIFGKKIEFSKELKLFTEKIQYRRLYPDNFLYTQCTDKYLVREYVKNKIGEKYLIPLYFIDNQITIKEWNELPNSFVIKPNHDTANTKIVFNKKELNINDRNKIINRLNLMLKINFGWYSLEKHYIEIKPKLIVEKLILDENKNIPEDYKFHCFKNKVYIQVIKRDLETHTLYMNYLTEDWQELNFETGGKILKNIKKPKNLDEMLKVAKKLSEDFDYVRVDLYNVNGKIYFGELTFTPFSGKQKFNPEKWDLEFGKEWK